MKRATAAATIVAAALLAARPATQDFGFSAAGGPGGPALNGITVGNNGVTGASSGTGLLNTTLGPSGTPAFNAVDVASGDFNGDGMQDIVAVSGDGSGGGQLTFFAGEGDGTFGLPVSFPLLSAPTSLAAADIDLDGLSDIAIGEAQGVQLITGSFLSSGIAPLSFDNFLPTDGPVVSVAFGRINDDPFSDIVAAERTDTPGVGEFQTFLNFATQPGAAPSFFSNGTTLVNGDPRAITTGVSNILASTPGAPAVDADLDVFVATSAGVEIYENNAATPGVFLNGPTMTSSLILSAGTAPVGVLVADVNGDNVPDVLALNPGSGTVSTFLGATGTTGGYSMPTVSLVGANPVSLSLLNFNGDSHVDLAVVNGGFGIAGGGVTLLAGNGSGIFTNARSLPLSTWPSILQAGANPMPFGSTLNVLNFCGDAPTACGSGTPLVTTQMALAAGAGKPEAAAGGSQPRDDAAGWWAALRSLGRDVGAWLALAAPRTAFAQTSIAPRRITPQVGGVHVTFTATGASSGDFFQMEIADDAGRTRRGSVPDGVVLEPVAGPARTAAPTARRGGVTRQPVGGFCLDFAKEPPAPGTQYRIASAPTQAQFGPLRSVLAATRQLALQGLLHPDSGAAGYYTFIRQYAVWAKRENWDAKKFGEAFLERTKKNVVAMKANWTDAMEQGVRASIPGRWRDIESAIRLSNQMMTPAR